VSLLDEADDLSFIPDAGRLGKIRWPVRPQGMETDSGED
jgi:hypothetical protein